MNRAVIGYLVLAAGMVAGLYLSFLADSHASDARKEICAEIERDKVEERAEIWRGFNDSKKTLRLLRIPFKTLPNGKFDVSDPDTKNLRDEIVASRNRRLALNPLNTCPAE